MIQDGKKIKIHYTLTVEGEVLESSADREPLEYTQGEKQIIPGLEKGLAGMHVGDHKQITVWPEEGYGPVDPKAFLEIPKSRLPQGNIEVGSILTTRTEAGQTLNAKVTDIRPETVLLDFNHPLAGKELLFDVEIVEIS